MIGFIPPWYNSYDIVFIEDILPYFNRYILVYVCKIGIIKGIVMWDSWSLDMKNGMLSLIIKETKPWRTIFNSVV